MWIGVWAGGGIEKVKFSGVLVGKFFKLTFLKFNWKVMG